METIRCETKEYQNYM